MRFSFKYSTASTCVLNRRMKLWPSTLHLMKLPPKVALPDLQACFHGHQPRKQHRFFMRTAHQFFELPESTRELARLLRGDRFEEEHSGRNLSLLLRNIAWRGWDSDRAVGRIQGYAVE